MPMKKFRATLKKERALILDPYLQDPALYFAYEPILPNKEVIVVPLKPAHKAVVEACNRLYGINRQELLDERFLHYATYVTYRHTLQSGIPAKLRKSIENRLAEMLSGSLRYTGMIRYFNAKKLEDLPWDFGL
jgi:hypothetical protein